MYLIAGFLWVGTSDLALAAAGEITDRGFLVAACKGAAYVLLSAGLVYWLCRREFRAAAEQTELLLAVVEGTTDAVFVKDLAGRYVLFNAAAAAFVGKPVETVLGRDDRDLFLVDDAERLMAADQAIMAGGAPVTAEEVLASAGVTRTYHATKVPFRDAAGAVIGLVGISRDVTEARRAEAAVRASEGRFRALADAIPQIVWTAGPDGGLTHVNARGLEYLGRSPGELIGRAWDEAVHPDDLPVLSATRADAVASGVPRDFEFRLRRADGVYRWHVSRQVPARANDGTVSGWYGTLTDIDDLKRTETDLRQTEARLREAQRIARLGSWSWEPPTDRVWWSDAEFELFGLDRATVTPSFAAFLAALHQGDRAVAIARVEAMKAGADEFADDLRVVRPDGEVLWIHSRARATRDAAGVLVRVEGTDQDITAQRLAQEAVRESEERYRLLFESHPHPMWVYDRETLAFLAVNDAASVKYGYTRNEFLTMTIADIRPPDDVPALSANVAAVSGGFEDAGVWRHSLKGGPVIRVRISSHTLTFADRPAEVVLAQDVTAQLEAEEARRASEQLLQEATRVAGVGVFEHDHRTGADFWSARLRDLMGYDPAAPAALAAYLAMVHPADRDAIAAAVGRAHDPAGDGRFDVLHRLIRPADGLVVWLAMQSQTQFDGEGPARRPIRTVGAVVDVTAARLAAETLREREERLRLAVRAANVGLWDWDVKADRVLYSPEWKAQLGYAPDEVGDLFAEWESRVHPDDLVKTLDLVRRSLTGPEDSHEIEFRMRHKDGSWRWIFTRAEVFRDAAGAPVRMLGGHIDVTDRRHTQDSLRASEERYRRLVEVLPEAVFINADDRVAYCNPACVELFGAADAAALVGKSPLDLFAPEYHDAIRDRIRHMRESGARVSGLDERVVRLDGRVAPVHVVATPIIDRGRPAILVCLRDLSERERAMDLLRSVLGSVGDAILTIDARGTVTSANQATERQFGYTESELIGGNVNVLMPQPHRGEHDRYVADYLRTGVARVIGVGREVDGRRKDGTTFPAELTVTEFARDGERHFTGVLRDISARRRLEEQFRQSQKMEAVGRLAGGVAHDFNNLLTVINGYADMLLVTLPVGDPAREPLAAIQDAGERAARLTQQLLAFSRKSVVQPQVLDLNELVAESAKLLRRLIGEDISLAVLSAPTPVRAVIDPGQFEQVLMNLSVNARDAMPTGGRLTIETRHVDLRDGGDRSHPDLPPGRYAALRVADTGCGMPPEVRDKIFEPFFTTKGVGKGTGLGLAVVHGVVKQAGGSVTVESAVGVGTTFTVLIPVAPGAPSGASSGAAQLAPRGSETVLLVEDEAAVRALVMTVLVGQGYTVLPASGGAEALERLRTHDGPVHLLVTDVVMPGMSGRELAGGARAARPGLRVLYMSGYTDDALDRHGLEGAGDRFIQKPFTPLALARRVRELLDRTE